MSTFVPGVTLGRQLHAVHVRPVLREKFPGLRHSAALLGRGSEVLGFDDETSTDHDWAARVLVFLAEEDEPRAAELGRALDIGLPSSLGGHPVHHEVHTVHGYVRQLLDVDTSGEISAADWLTIPEHALRTFASGAIFHDELDLQAVRDRLAYYPRDVWLYLLISAWWRVHPEMNLVGRAGDVGDELGSSVMAARLVKDLMRLAFLMERQYAPYPKWFGTGFSRLACGPDLTPALWQVLRAEAWEEREAALVRAYEGLFALHNRLGLTAPVTPHLVRMWDRPFEVAWADVPDLLVPMIEDPGVLRVVKEWPVGPIDQLRELTWAPRHRRALVRVFDDQVVTDA